MRQACKYNIIRFQPYAEIQEFANIGVVLYAPKTGQFIFKVLPQSTHNRITSFFATLDERVLQSTLSILKGELVRLQQVSGGFDDFELLYNELVRPREGIIQYSKHFARFTESPQATTDQLFEHYVHHRFTNMVGND